MEEPTPRRKPRRKKLLYFDMEKIDEHDEDLCKSEREVLGEIGYDLKDNLFLKFSLEEALASLTEKQREAFLLVCQDGLTMEEAGERLGISKPSVFELVAKAKVHLQRMLSR